MEEARRQQPPGVYVSHAKTEPPRWMRHHVFKRGLAFFFGGKLCLFTLAIFFGPKPPALVTGVGYLFEGIALLGIPLIDLRRPELFRAPAPQTYGRIQRDRGTAAGIIET